MNSAKCPVCSELCVPVIDAAFVLKQNEEFRTLGGWYCDNCCMSWFKEKKSKETKTRLLAERKARYAKKESKSV